MGEETRGKGWEDRNVKEGMGGVRILTRGGVIQGIVKERVGTGGRKDGKRKMGV